MTFKPIFQLITKPIESEIVSTLCNESDNEIGFISLVFWDACGWPSGQFQISIEIKELLPNTTGIK